jgi:hypothetical protein
MTVSKITHTDIANYIRLTEVSSEDTLFLTNLIKVAIEFIKSYTGLSIEEIDKHEDFYIVICILCQDMYDNRTLYVDKSNLNKVVETILGMHRVNLL